MKDSIIKVGVLVVCFALFMGVDSVVHKPTAQVNQSSTTLWSPMSGTTTSIGGSLLVAGACSTGTVAVSGSLAGQPVAVSASDGTNMAAVGAYVHGDVTVNGTVTVSVCAIISLTPATKTYNVRVLP